MHGDGSSELPLYCDFTYQYHNMQDNVYVQYVYVCKYVALSLVISQAFSRAHRIGQSNKVSERDICVIYYVANVGPQTQHVG